MNCKLPLQVLATLLLIVASMVGAAAQTATGAIDPTTGLPIGPPPPPPWMDPNWNVSGKVLSNVNFEGRPINEVAKFMREQFTNDNFAIIIPSSYALSNSISEINPGAGNTINPGEYRVSLNLKMVGASELFYAMNLEFEAENTPVRWQLIMNGNVSTAVLHVVPELLPHALLPPPAPESKRMVFYVGDLMGTEKSGGMTLQQVRQAVELTYHAVFQKEVQVAEYPDAQLLIIYGTADDIDFVHQTLEALKQKVQSARKERSAPAESSPPAPEQTAGASAGSK
jgi:hypothetical protein